LDELVAVRYDQRHIGRPQFQQFGKRRDDDRLAETGRKRNELGSKSARSRFDNRLLRLDLIRA
jgi:hypothetical protein